MIKQRKAFSILPKGMLIASIFFISTLLYGCSLINPEIEEPISTPVESAQNETPVIEVPIDDHLSYLDAPAESQSGKYMFRAAWLPSVLNSGYPETQGMSTDELKKSFLKILDVYEIYNLNAIIMQVRPSGDALYLSELNPASVYITGKIEGVLPFDLLKFAVDETHKRGMEFHAWFNPYRVTVIKAPGKTTEDILSTLSEKNYARLHPDKVLRFDDKLFLNPGDPEVMEFVTLSIMEVVKNYDIDAIHLDDYFYPYRSTKTDENGASVPYYFGDENEDEETYLANQGAFTDIKSWRRDNVTQFVKNLNEKIKDLKPYVKLGISPFGIWGHAEETDGLGSNTPVTSSETYKNMVFADTRKWVKDEIIDYIIPQIYWSFDETAAPYKELATWWSSVVEGTDVSLYIGHANYKLFEQASSPSWKGDTVISEQLAFNKTLPNIKGSSFFSFKYLTPLSDFFKDNAEGRQNLIKNNEAIKEDFKTPAIIPYNYHFTKVGVAVPKEIKIVNEVLSFKDGNEEFDEVKKTKFFLVYQFPKDDIDPSNPSYIYKKIIYDQEKTEYAINHLDTETYVYAVSAFNRLSEESKIALIDTKP
ncbi:MAG: family 10 glycosylhydrolase [Clostridiaceae bacterium]